MTRVSFEVPFPCSSGQWRGLTYPGHTSWSIDLNRGYGDSDAGVSVLCSLSGIVTRLDPAYGVVEVSSANGYSVVYGHLQRIRVKLHQRVVTFQQLGAVGHTYPPPGHISSHLHYQQERYGSTIPIRFLGVRYPASLRRVDSLLYGPVVEGRCP